MEMKSKIKALFSEELRRYIGAICDTRQIQSNQEKMDLLQRLFIREGIQADQLGGATNRFVVMIDGYAVKIAMDRQGYKDNLMEYALSPEMQPFVTKSYETNGYVLIQECVRILSIEEWRLRRTEIIKMLDALGREYLLGDVGYFDVNMTNWGVRDSGELVILDYAYCHRLTEDLFTCSVCGSLLTYDQNFVSILCTDRANCHQKYSYNQIKARQGDTVDLTMIEEKKDSSVIVPPGQDSVHVEKDSDTLLDSRTFVIRSYSDMEKYKEVKSMLTIDCTDQEVLSKLRSIMIAKCFGDEEKVKRLEYELYGESEQTNDSIRCIIDPEFQERLEEDRLEEEEAMMYGYDYDPETGCSPNNDDEDDLSKYTFEGLFDYIRERQQSHPEKFHGNYWCDEDDECDQEEYYHEESFDDESVDEETDEIEYRYEESVPVDEETELLEESDSDSTEIEYRYEDSFDDETEETTFVDYGNTIPIDNSVDEFDENNICETPLEDSEDLVEYINKESVAVDEPMEEPMEEQSISSIPDGFTDEPIALGMDDDSATECVAIHMEEVGYEDSRDEPEQIIVNDFPLSTDEETELLDESDSDSTEIEYHQEDPSDGILVDEETGSLGNVGDNDDLSIISEENGEVLEEPPQKELEDQSTNNWVEVIDGVRLMVADG